MKKIAHLLLPLTILFSNGIYANNSSASTNSVFDFFLLGLIAIIITMSLKKIHENRKINKF